MFIQIKITMMHTVVLPWILNKNHKINDISYSYMQEPTKQQFKHKENVTYDNLFQ